MKDIEDLQEVIEYLWKIQEETKLRQIANMEKHYGTPQPSIHARHCRRKSPNSYEQLTPIPILPEIPRFDKVTSPFKARHTIESYLKSKNAMFKCITAKNNNEERQYFNLSRYKNPASNLDKESTIQTRFPSLGRNSLISNA